MRSLLSRSLITTVIFMLCVISPAAGAPKWWQAETAMGTSGTLRLDTKPWWEQAKALKVGEQFVLRSTFPGGGLMLVRKEQAANPKYGQMIVWTLDDDGDMEANNPKPDRDSDCYVADYNGDGTVDRVLDFIDNNRDNVQDEMEIRYFRNSELRYGWFAFDLDRDGHTWFTRDYEASALYPFFRSDPYGNNLFFLNKFNGDDNAWIPFSECPFAFFDDDKDGYSERVARFSAVPRSFMKQNGNPDYANRYQYMYGPFTKEMRDMCVVNLRYSLDIDGLSDARHPLHYEMGFNMTGDLPYKFRGMEHPNPLRREPKTVMVAPFEKIKKISESYPATETGFSFMEFEDGSIRIGDPEGDEAGDRRWEGVFWMWNRRLMHNSGGPTQFWNIRREWSNKPAKRREVYYSPVDRRLHLKGASEGWIRIGKIGIAQTNVAQAPSPVHDSVSNGAIGETHMYDSDGDGYFDRWEYFDAGTPLPVRVDRVNHINNIDFGDNWAAIQKFYTEKALPEALRLDQAVIDAIAATGPEYATPVADNLKQALQRELSPTERRYILDLVRDNAYRHWREVSLAAQQKILDTPAKLDHSYSATNTATAKAWLAFQMLAVIDDLYAQGKFAEVAAGIRELK